MTEIYIITNSVNDKVYIGKTKVGLKKRFYYHRNDRYNFRHKHKKLYVAMNEIGADKFNISLLKQCEDKDGSYWEQFYINKYDSFNNGYNGNLGGDGRLIHNHDKIISLLSEDMCAKDIAKISNCHFDTVRNIANSVGIRLKDRKVTDKRSKQIIQLDYEYNELNIFDSLAEAGKYIANIRNIPYQTGMSGHIYDVCIGKRKVAYGFKWKYKENSTITTSRRVLETA